jgi:hypothetical protein
MRVPAKHVWTNGDSVHEWGYHPVESKATGGSIPSMDVMRLAIGGQGPKNWLKGSVENVVQPLKINHRPNTPENEAELQAELQDATSRNDQRMLEAVQADMRGMKHGAAINQWIERNLANYIKKQMATHDDPIRKLAEQGIVHIAPDQVGLNRHYAEDSRRMMDGTKLAKSPEAEAWEDAADVAMGRTKVKNLLEVARLKGPHDPKTIEPWMEKADPETHLYFPQDSMHAHYLGFDHIVDVLKQDLAEGRIRPEQLSKVSIEHAVRRTHEYDQERKKAMAETALKATEGMPVHKEYPEGYKWIELTMPKDLPEGWKEMEGHPGIYIDPEGKNSIHNPNRLKLEDALKYEGDTMGHCVGGYCPDVASGQTRIFSLRDAKNEPHVTIEVRPHKIKTWDDVTKSVGPEQASKLWNEFDSEGGNNVSDVEHAFDYFVKKKGVQPHHSIKQIKGKGNAKPKKQYIPYVQDFVKSGNWSDVGDIQNTDLMKVKGDDIPGFEQWMKLKAHGSVPSIPEGVYTKDELLNFGKQAGLHEAHPSVFSKWQEKLGGYADGGEVDAETVFMAKGGSTIKQLEEYLRDREGEYGLKRLQRAADEIPGLENMYTLQALKEAFGGDNAKALMTMNPADFERFAVRLFSDPDTREDEMNEKMEYVRGLPPMTHHEYIKYLAKIKGGFADVPFLEVHKRPEYLPNISGHEGRHRSRAFVEKGAKKSLVRLLPSPSMREPMPRKYREDFIEAMKKELGEKRLVTGENRSLLPADLEAPEHKNIERRNMLGGRPQLPEIYKDGGDVDAESCFFPKTKE